MDIKSKATAHLIGPLFSSRSNDKRMADLLVGGNLYLRDTPAFDITNEIDWSADPYGDRNWQFIYHSLRWTEPLRRMAVSSEDEVYGRLYERILKSWVNDNILASPKSSYAWYDMSSGIRACVFAAAISLFGETDWLLEALEVHGNKMSSPSFGAKVGNHALHVRIGLLVAGDLLNRSDWVDLARGDIERLFNESINHEGVDFEGGMQYQTSNYFWYQEAEAHLGALGIEASDFRERLAKMPVFLTHSVNTLGRPVQFGDSDPIKLAGIDSPELEYIRSSGAKGNKPTEIYSHYEGGYTFGRTNWNLDVEQQGLFYSLRHGPASGTQPHADHDGGVDYLDFQGP
ncbi:heparinase II/III family protein [Glutamicibacter arilaitensis]|uniref:heparinase II/III family protein n=1 Tax=Glutamicibacter arilaitensis TaxID=256701 RepID=UPI003FD1D358